MIKRPVISERFFPAMDPHRTSRRVNGALSDQGMAGCELPNLRANWNSESRTYSLTVFNPVRMMRSMSCG